MSLYSLLAIYINYWQREAPNIASELTNMRSTAYALLGQLAATRLNILEKYEKHEVLDLNTDGEKQPNYWQQTPPWVHAAPHKSPF